MFGSTIVLFRLLVSACRGMIRWYYCSSGQGAREGVLFAVPVGKDGWIEQSVMLSVSLSQTSLTSIER